MPAGWPGNSVTKAARAKTGGGFESAIVTVSAPGAPTFTVSKSSTSITATITDAAGATSYESSVDGTTWVSGLTASGLTAETPYTFQVRGINSAGTGAASSQAVTTNAASALSLVAESGYSITGDVSDLAEVTISGQDFGTKPPVRHFDRIDRYWDNGTEVVSPYSGQSDGDFVPNQSQVANSPFPATGTNTDFNAWLLRQEAARQGRPFGYQLESGPASGRMNGTTDAGFAGWPVAQRDSEELYMRFWHYQRYFSAEDDANFTTVDMKLATSLPTGATSATVIDGFSAMGSAVGGQEEFYITLDDGTLHYCQQTEPEIDDQNFTFTPALPSPASAGNQVYMRDEFTVKMMRVKDAGPDPTDSNQQNAYGFSGFRADISNDVYSREPGLNRGAYVAGQWNLYEIYLRAPKLEAERDANFTKRVRINGTLRLDITGILNTNGGLTGVNGAIKPPVYGWPSTGLAVVNFGFEEDRDHAVPNNSVRYSDIYLDGQSSGLGARRRVEIGIGNDDLYLCSNREPCPVKTWDNSITVNFNALPFTEQELAQARIFVVDTNDVPTLVGRVQ